MRLLFINRYRSPAMHAKTMLLACAHGMTIHTVFPLVWMDEYGRIEQDSTWASRITAITTAPVGIIGRTSDPHRATYRTLDFGMRRFRPDVILAEEEPDSVAALHVAAARKVFAPRAKLVLYTWQNQARPLGTIVRLVQSITLRAADAVICANSEAVDLLRGHGFHGPAPIIPANGVDPHRFATQTHLPRALRIGYVGRLAVEKGLDDLLDAFATLRDLDAHLTLVGDGPYRDALVQRVAALGLAERVTFAGALSGRALVDAYHELTMLILPSRTTPVWKEQFGRVLVEAMACGVPVIGSDSGAIPEVIGDAGMIFPEGDVDALAQTITMLCDSSDLRRSFGMQGIERVRDQFTQERIADRYAAFLTEVMHS